MGKLWRYQISHLGVGGIVVAETRELAKKKLNQNMESWIALYGIGQKTSPVTGRIRM